jgi:hypothetical protein
MSLEKRRSFRENLLPLWHFGKAPLTKKYYRLFSIKPSAHIFEQANDHHTYYLSGLERRLGKYIYRRNHSAFILKGISAVAIRRFNKIRLAIIFPTFN